MAFSNDTFENRINSVLADRPKTKLPSDGLTTAAVLVPLYTDNGDYHVLLTKRSDHVEHHRGEISFPGGKFDPEDVDFKTCALRETSEEIGVHPSDVRIAGELDDFYTVATKFLVVPFVGFIPYPYTFKPSVREIAGLLPVPLNIFRDPNRRSEQLLMFQGQEFKVTSYLWKGHNIWGATARIMKHFVEIIEENQL